MLRHDDTLTLILRDYADIITHCYRYYRYADGHYADTYHIRVTPDIAMLLHATLV